MRGANYRKKRDRNNAASKKKPWKKKRKKEAEKAKKLLEANTDLTEKLQAALNKIDELEKRLEKCSCAWQIGLSGEIPIMYSEK